MSSSQSPLVARFLRSLKTRSVAFLTDRNSTFQSTGTSVACVGVHGCVCVLFILSMEPVGFNQHEILDSDFASCMVVGNRNNGRMSKRSIKDSRHTLFPCDYGCCAVETAVHLFEYTEDEQNFGDEARVKKGKYMPGMTHMHEVGNSRAHTYITCKYIGMERMDSSELMIGSYKVFFYMGYVRTHVRMYTLIGVPVTTY